MHWDIGWGGAQAGVGSVGKEPRGLENTPGLELNEDWGGPLSLRTEDKGYPLPPVLTSSLE